MQFYKKNPKIKGMICVQGEMLGDDDIVCGDEFKPFSEPSEMFPDRPPKLVQVSFKKLKKTQQEQAQEFAAKQEAKPPRHLGVIKSESFTSTDGGEVKVIDTAPKKPQTPAKPPEAPKAPETPKEPVKDPEKPAPKLLSELYTHATLAEEFPGVTEKNAKKVLKAAGTLKELAETDNASLRKMGINPSFYGRLRERAAELAEQAEADQEE